MFTKKRWLGAGALASVLVTFAAAPSLAAGGWSLTTVAAGAGNNVTLNSAFARTNTDAWAVGTQFAPAGATAPTPPTFHWNGTSWSYVPTPAIGKNAALFSVSASSATDAWAVGTIVGGQDTTLLEHWNGTAWTVDTADAITAREAHLTSVLDLSSANAYAIGTGPGGTLFEHWNGSAWSRLTLPEAGFRPGVYSQSISASSASDIWVVGTSFAAATGQTVAEALHFNGTAWSVVPMAQPPAGTPAITAVTAISPTDAWAVGLNGTPLLENWNGKAWTIVPSPALKGVFVTRFTGVAARSANDVIAVGTAIPSAVSTGGEQAVILRWNGTSWSDDTGATLTGGYYAAATFPGAAKEFVVGYTNLGAILSHS